MLGNWSAIGKAEEVISVFDGLKAALPKAKITYIEGYDLETNELKPLPDFSEYDVIIVSVGERAMESGEAKSKVDININANQQLMVKQIKEKAGKPVITFSYGRPSIDFLRYGTLCRCYSYDLVAWYGSRQFYCGCAYW